MPSDERDYAAIAAGYVDDVLSGRIPACRWTIGACERQRFDLARQGAPGFPYRYDPERGVRVCRMLELLPHIKGRWSSRRFD